MAEVEGIVRVGVSEKNATRFSGRAEWWQEG
jgi:hypothetical protein